MSNKPSFMGNPFNPDGVVRIVGLVGQGVVELGGPLTHESPGIWSGGGELFNSRGVQVMESGELVRPPSAMAVNV